MLDTAGLLGGLEKYAGNVIRKRSSSPKFQVHNMALIAAQSANTLKEILRSPYKWGRVVESSVGAHLMNTSLTEKFKLWYWRDGNDEIDFVIENKGKIIGLEVKSGSSRRTSGMAAFKKYYNPHKVVLVGNEGIPWEQFLSLNPVELF